MARKIALLIGVSEYGAGLNPLQCPANGVAAVRAVLTQTEIGGFDQVICLINPDVGEMRSRLCEIFATLTKQDLLLFYFTGHGLKDLSGDFYLTTRQTELFESGRLNTGTAVDAHFIRRELSQCLAQRKVVILDCCFGAAFAKGFLTMADDSLDLEAQFGGKGWCVLTASTSSRYALEQVGEPLSVYTRYLVEGLKTGGAATDGQPYIRAQDLHEYVSTQVKAAAPAMEPALFNGQQGYDIIIARARINNAQRYRKQVQSKIRDGKIGPAGRAALTQWQNKLNLSPEEALNIESELLKPHRERQKHLAVYARALKAEKDSAYPLAEDTLRDLKDLQRVLSLRDEDVAVAERHIIGEPVGSLTFDISPATVPIPAAARSVVQPVASPPLTLTHFETPVVDCRGKQIQVYQSSAAYYTQMLSPDIPLEMVKIPEGTFLMGARDGEQEANTNEFPQREQSVAGFWMSRFPITCQQWNAILRRRGSAIAHCTQSQQEAAGTTSLHPIAQQENLNNQADLKPVSHVFWTQAVEFCLQLSHVTGRAYQLPSSVQWEYACRAGTTTPFAYGETLLPTLANYNGNYAYARGPKGIFRRGTTAVDSFAPNAFGLHDMHGNVWEWCLDGWQTFDPHNLNRWHAQQFSSHRKSLRGGSWFYPPTTCRSAHFLTYPFHNRTDDIGFRVICTRPID